jgi:3-deoxy-D-manno-octulosonic acid kinase
MTALPAFELVRRGRDSLLVRREAQSWLIDVLLAARHGCAGYRSRPIGSGRGGTVVVTAGEHEVVVRHSRRGGLPARFLHDVYFGLRPRPFIELHVTETLRQRGAPVIQPLGAVAHWVFPGVYRSWLASAYIPRSRTLWEWLQEDPAAPLREETFARVGVAIRQLHANGARHPDLNLNNVLVCEAEPPATARVLLVDFDRARLAAPSLRAALADLARLRRSARKLDPGGRTVTDDDLRVLEKAYHSAG